MRGIPADRQSVRRKLVETVGLDSKSVLDVGCATCIDYPLFSQRGIEYVGVDFTRRLLVWRIKHLKTDVVRGDGRLLPFRNDCFDSVYCKDVLIHLGPQDYKRLIGEMWRVCRKQTLLVWHGLPLNGEPTQYRIRTSEKWPVHYNRYSKTEIMEYINTLSRLASVEVYSDVDPSIRNCGIYRLRKAEHG